jgi:putative acetyltransferase
VKRAAAYSDGGWLDELVMARLRDTEQLAPARPPLATSVQRGERPADLTIRPLHPDDGEELYQMLRHPAVSHSTLQLPSQEVGLWEQRARETRPTLHRLVATTEGRMVGNITLHQPLNPRLWHAAGLGMSVHPNYWGRSIGGALLEAALDLADNWLNLKRVQLQVHVDNPAAIHLYEKFGFEIEGRCRFHTYGSGGWIDSYFMGRLRTRPG